VELVSWVLGFGDKARVIEPDVLRSAVVAEVRGMASTYASAS
jgi:predicted DNA-binding transcriptional regulator YafY